MGRFRLDNDGDLERCGAGVSYPQATYIRIAVRGGTFVPLHTRIPCHSPSERRWFDLSITSRIDHDGRCLGTRVSLRRTYRADARTALVGV